MKADFKLIPDSQVNSIYQSMREASLRIDIEEVQVVKGADDFDPIQIPAWVSLEQGRLFLNLRGVPKQAEFEDAISHFRRLQGKTVTIRPSDYIQARAKTVKGIPILLEGVAPVIGRGSSHYSHAGGTRSLKKIEFNRIAFPAAGWDALNSEEQRQHLLRVCGSDSDAVENTEKKIPKDVFYAILPDVEQRIFNGGTKTVTTHPYHGEISSSPTDCFTGQLLGGEFCLEKHDAGILINYDCPVGDSTPEEARANFHGLLRAIAFTHGCNPWPDYLSHRRDQKVIDHWMQPRSHLQCQPMLLLRDDELSSHTSGKGEKLFLAAARFFAKPYDNASKFNKALWLLREACREGTPKEISVLTLCSVLDGLVDPLRGKKPDGKLKGEKLRQFRWIDPIESKLEIPFKEVEQAVHYWDKYRNPLAHGFEEANADDKAEILDAYAHLFGAVYGVMARQMGFTESMPQSRFK